MKRRCSSQTQEQEEHEKQCFNKCVKKRKRIFFEPGRNEYPLDGLHDLSLEDKG